MGSAVPAACNGHERGLVYGRRLKRHRCRNCGHQATLEVSTIMQIIKWPLNSWFLAFDLIGPGQDWHLLSGAQPPPGRQRRHGLAAAQQDSAGDG
jgi:hypothetical protein